jgi:excisionase family DNA binding protein
MAVMMDERLLTVTDVAKALAVDEETIRRWVRAGKVKAIQPGGQRGTYRIPESELRRLLTGQPPAD